MRIVSFFVKKLLLDAGQRKPNAFLGSLRFSGFQEERLRRTETFNSTVHLRLQLLTINLKLLRQLCLSQAPG